MAWAGKPLPAYAAAPDAREVNPHLHVLQVSASWGEGLAHWYNWLRRQVAQVSALDRPAVASQT